MNWSGEQLRILRELGHEPMRLASSMPAEAPPGAVPPSGALAAAIARAGGGGDLSALALDIEKLRREPALKRALWPKLRALRRGH